MDPSGYLGYLSNPGTLEYYQQNSEVIDYSANKWAEPWNAIPQYGGASLHPTGGWYHNNYTGYYQNMYGQAIMSGGSFASNTPYLISPEHVDSDPNKVFATILGVKSISFYPGVDPDGGRMALIGYKDGTFAGSGIPFWMISGSYYNHHYFLSGVQAYADAAFVMRLIASKLDGSAIIPAAISWELNGSSEAGVASNASIIGAILALRGQDAGKIKFFASGGIGVGYLGVSGQFIKMRYHYFGGIDNFSFQNTFIGSSYDFDFTVGHLGIAGGAQISIMFNNDPNYYGEFMIGVGTGIGFGTPGLSGSGTWNFTDMF